MAGLLKRIITAPFVKHDEEDQEEQQEQEPEPEPKGDTTIRFETAFGAIKRTEDKVKAVKEVSDGLVDESAKLRQALKGVKNV